MCVCVCLRSTLTLALTLTQVFPTVFVRKLPRTTLRRVSRVLLFPRVHTHAVRHMSGVDWEKFREDGKVMVDFIADYFKSIEERRVAPDVSPGYLKPLLPATAPEVRQCHPRCRVP